MLKKNPKIHRWNLNEYPSKILICLSTINPRDQIKAKGFNYLGEGDLDKAIFDLDTEAAIEDFSFSFKGGNYLKNKKVNTELITKINTNSLSFIFEENNLKINKLPIDFVGKLDFLSNGYDLDFKIESLDSPLADFFTALPPAYVTWLDKTQVRRANRFSFYFKRKKYCVHTNQSRYRFPNENPWRRNQS